MSPVRLRVAYSELTPGQAVPWISYEAGIFARHGLDVPVLATLYRLLRVREPGARGEG